VKFVLIGNVWRQMLERIQKGDATREWRILNDEKFNEFALHMWLLG
jgi:hypothetical protein